MAAPPGTTTPEPLGLNLPPLGWRGYPALASVVVLTVLSYLAQLTWIRWQDALALSGPEVRAGEWWRLTTVVLVHGTWAHLGSNLAALVIWGRSIERRFGPFGLLGIYALTALGSGTASTLANPTGASIGASGAVFGVMGAIVAVLWLAHRRPGVTVQLQLAAGFAAFSLVVAAAFPNVDNVAHLAGLVLGLGLGGLFDVVRTRYLKARRSATQGRH